MFKKTFAIVTLLAAALPGCLASPGDSDEPAETTREAQSALRATAVEVDYYSDATLTNLVGYRIYGCNGITNWGQHTSYIEVDELYSCQSGGGTSGGIVGCYASGYCSPEFGYCVSC